MKLLWCSSLILALSFSFAASAAKLRCDLSAFDFDSYSTRAGSLKNIFQDACDTRKKLCHHFPKSDACPGNEPNDTEEFGEARRKNNIKEDLNAIAKKVFEFGNPKQPTAFEIANYEAELDLLNALSFSDDPMVSQTVEELVFWLQGIWNERFYDRLMKKIGISESEYLASHAGGVVNIGLLAAAYASEGAPKRAKSLRKIFRQLVPDRFLRRSIYGTVFVRLAYEGGYDLAQLFEEAPVPAPVARVFIKKNQKDFTDALKTGDWTNNRNLLTTDLKIAAEMNKVYRDLIPELYSYTAGTIIAGAGAGRLWRWFRNAKGNVDGFNKSKVGVGLKRTILTAIVFTAATVAAEQIPAQLYKRQISNGIKDALKEIKNLEAIEKTAALMELQGLVNALDHYYNEDTYPKFFASLPVFDFLFGLERARDKDIRHALKANILFHPQAGFTGADKWKDYICRALPKFKPRKEDIAVDRKLIGLSNFYLSIDGLIDDHEESSRDFRKHLQKLLKETQTNASSEAHNIFARAIENQGQKIKIARDMRRLVEDKKYRLQLENFLYDWSYEIEPLEAERQGQSYTDYRRENYLCPERQSPADFYSPLPYGP